MALEASGPRWATKILNEAITRALEQTDGNLIRNPTLGEISAGAKLTTVVQVRIGEGATNDQIDDFIAEMGRIPDSNGATSGGFLGGHTTIRDAEGERVVAMHGGFYKTGNFLVEVDKVMAQINSSAKRIFGPDSQVDTTDRIVEAYGHDPSAKYKQPLQGGEGETDGKNEQNRSRRKTVETVSIGRQAEQGLRAYFLSSLAAAAAKRRGTVTSGKDAQDVLGEFVSHIENYFAFRSKRVAKLAPETKQAVGIANPKEALVALSARAIAEGLENPKVLGLASLLWDLAQRVQRGGIADVQIHKSMTPQEMRDVNTALLERVAFKSEREVGKRRAKIEDDMRKEGRKKALEQEVEDDKLREAAATPAPEGETAPQKDKRVKEFERRIAAALKAKEKREKELEKDIAAALKAVLPGKGVILKGGGKYSVPTGFAALPLEVGSVLLVNKRRAEYDHGENWREAAVEAQKKKTAIKVYLETLAPVAGAYGYAVTTTLDGQVSRAEVISDEVGRRIIGELEAEEESLAETPSEPSDIKMSKSIDELGVDESTQNVQGANRDGTYSTEKSQGDQRRGDRGGRSDSRRAEALPGAPRIQKASGPDPGLNRVAERYARSIGLNLARQSHYAEVDEDLAKSIADAYEQMPHDPLDPVVAEAYANLIRQTVAHLRNTVAAPHDYRLQALGLDRATALEALAAWDDPGIPSYAVGKAPRFKRSLDTLTELAKDSEGFKSWFVEFKDYLEKFLVGHEEYAPLVNEFLAATAVEVNVPLMVKYNPAAPRPSGTGILFISQLAEEIVGSLTVQISDYRQPGRQRAPLARPAGNSFGSLN